MRGLLMIIIFCIYCLVRHISFFDCLAKNNVVQHWMFLSRNPTSFLEKLLEEPCLSCPLSGIWPRFILHLQHWSCLGLGCPCELQQVEDRSLQIYAALAHLFTGKVIYPFEKSVIDLGSFKSRSWHQAKAYSESIAQSLLHYCVICKSRVAGSFGINLEERSVVIGSFLSLW